MSNSLLVSLFSHLSFVIYFDPHKCCSWSPKTMHEGKPWTGPDQFEDSTGKIHTYKKFEMIYLKSYERERLNSFMVSVLSSIVLIN